MQDVFPSLWSPRCETPWEDNKNRMDWSRQLWVTAVFLPVCILRNFPWEQLNLWLIPHSLIRSLVQLTTFLIGCGAYKGRKIGNLKGRNLLAKEHAWQSQRSSFPPPVTGTNHSCRLTTSALLAAARTQHTLYLPLTHNSELCSLCECRAASS